MLVIGVPEARTSARPGLRVSIKAGFDVEIPGALRPIGIDALQRRHVGGEGKLSELLRLVDDDLVDADLGDGQQVVLASGESLQTLLQTFLEPLEALARDAILAVDFGQQILIELQLILDHRLFKGGGNRDEAESGMSDDDRVPRGGRRARQEPCALVLRKIGLVGDENAGIGIET